MADPGKMIEFYSRYVVPGGVVFDVGANVGNRTSVFLQLGARVVAVEPQANCMRRLMETFGQCPVAFVPKALGAQEGHIPFFTSIADPISSSSPAWIERVRNSGRFSMYEWDQGSLVPATTLDALIRQYGRPDFCKIDVEGYEPEVLQGLTVPIPALSFEFTPEYLDAAVRCVRILQGLGPYRFNYSLLESMELALPCEVDADQIIRLLEDLPEKWVFGDVYARLSPSTPT